MEIFCFFTIVNSYPYIREGLKVRHMATDPVCGMFVEEKLDSIQHIVDGRKYYSAAHNASMNLPSRKENYES
jgi:YHS domain-containing protein